MGKENEDKAINVRDVCTSGLGNLERK